VKEEKKNLGKRYAKRPEDYLGCRGRGGREKTNEVRKVGLKRVFTKEPKEEGESVGRGGGGGSLGQKKKPGAEVQRLEPGMKGSQRPS